MHPIINYISYHYLFFSLLFIFQAWIIFGLQHLISIKFFSEGEGEWEGEGDSFKESWSTMNNWTRLIVRWRSLTLLSPHREWKAKVFDTKGEFCVFFFFYLHRDMQVLPDSGTSIVLLLFKKKITRWCSWRLKSVLKKKSQSVGYGMVASHRTCQTTLHINRQTERGKLKKNKQAKRQRKV